MANDNLFFKKLAQVHPRFQTPAWAIIALGVWSAILSCAGNSPSWLPEQFLSDGFSTAWGRQQFSHPPRFKRPANSLSRARLSVDAADLRNVAAAISGNAIFLAFIDPRQFRYLAVAIVIFLLGLPAYYFWRRKHPRPNFSLSPSLHQTQRIHIHNHRRIRIH